MCGEFMKMLRIHWQTKVKGLIKEVADNVECVMKLMVHARILLVSNKVNKNSSSSSELQQFPDNYSAGKQLHIKENNDFNDFMKPEAGEGSRLGYICFHSAFGYKNESFIYLAMVKRRQLANQNA